MLFISTDKPELGETESDFCIAELRPETYERHLSSTLSKSSLKRTFKDDKEEQEEREEEKEYLVAKNGCKISWQCWTLMTSPGYSGYALTHQILYLLVGQNVMYFSQLFP